MSKLQTVQSAEIEKAQKGFTLSNSNSFQDNAVFKITGYTFTKLYNDDGTPIGEKLFPTLETTIGLLMVSRITRAKIDSKGNILKPSGTINKEIIELIRDNSDKNDGEVLQLIVDKFKDSEIICNLQEFVAKRGDYEYTTALLNLNYK